jgi:hypothetical protein
MKNPLLRRGSAIAVVTACTLAAPVSAFAAAPASAAPPASLPARGLPAAVSAVQPLTEYPQTPPAPPAGPLRQTGCTITGTDATCDLWAKTGQLVLPGSAAPVAIWGFAGTAAGAAATPGPVLVVDQGDSVTLTVHNALADNLSLAVPAQTGLAPDTSGAAPGGTKTYRFTARRAGTYRYEAGHTAAGARQAIMGLVGALVVRAPQAGGKPTAYGDAGSAYDDEATLVLTEVDPAFNADPMHFDLRKYHPQYRLINGKAFPETDPVATDVGRRVLLRYVNAGLSAHPMSMLGVDQAVIGQDSRPTAYPEGAVTVPLAPGQTTDAITTMPPGPDGRRFMLFEPGGQLNNAGQTYGTATPGVSPTQAFGGIMTYLDTNPQVATGDHVGPVVTGLSATPDPATVTAPVTVTATFSDVRNGNSPVDAAELVIDDLGIAEGTGTAFTGSFGSPTVTGATAVLAPADLTRLSQGRHTLWVRAHDSAGNWGVVSSVTVNLSVTGAVTTGLTVAPNPVGGLVDLAVSATGDDRAIGGTVTGAEYFVDGTGTSGTGTAMTLNVSGAAVSAETATIPATVVGALTEGRHTVAVHTRDSLGLWGPLASADLVVDRTGPTQLEGAVLPAVTNGVDGSPADPTDLRINAAFTDTTNAGVHSTIAAAEGFIDAAGPDGSGFTFLALDGTFNQATENAYGLVPLSELTRLPDGAHQMLVHARDAAGNWGPLTGLTFTVDRTGPPATVTASGSAGVVTLTGTATDALSGIAAAEWYQGTDPGVGAATAMTVTATSATTAKLSATTAMLSNGAHAFWVRVRDTAGNWGKASSVTTTVTGSKLIFADGFDNGTAAWSQTVGGARVAPSAAFGNSAALTVTGSTPAYVVDNSPVAERTLHAQFGFAAGTFATRGVIVDLLQARAANGSAVLTVQYQRTTAGVSQVRVGALTSTGWKYSAWSTIAATAVSIKVDWSSATAGTAALSVNGTTVATVTGNTSARTVESVALGVAAAAGRTTGAGAIDAYSATR